MFDGDEERQGQGCVGQASQRGGERTRYSGTGDPTPAGAWPRVPCPQTQSRSTSWCSTTRTATGGISNSWRRVTDRTGRPARSRPQPEHTTGSWTTTSSGSATWRNVCPGCPACPPGLRPDRRRSERGAGLVNGESVLGGLLEFWES